MAQLNEKCQGFLTHADEYSPEAFMVEFEDSL